MIFINLRLFEKYLRYCNDFSTRKAMLAIVVTASTGYRPAAVSPESIMASVPSKMAFATSLASARSWTWVTLHRIKHLCCSNNWFS